MWTGIIGLEFFSLWASVRKMDSTWFPWLSSLAEVSNSWIKDKISNHEARLLRTDTHWHIMHICKHLCSVGVDNLILLAIRFIPYKNPWNQHRKFMVVTFFYPLWKSLSPISFIEFMVRNLENKELPQMMHYWWRHRQKPLHVHFDSNGEP